MSNTISQKNGYKETKINDISEERKYIYDEVNIYNNNIEFNTEVKRTKTKFINDSNIIRLLEEMVIECKNTLRKTK